MTPIDKLSVKYIKQWDILYNHKNRKNYKVTLVTSVFFYLLAFSSNDELEKMALEDLIKGDWFILKRADQERGY
jgi:hypothetical protein